jgi:hypothetical protein
MRRRAGLLQTQKKRNQGKHLNRTMGKAHSQQNKKVVKPLQVQSPQQRRPRPHGGAGTLLTSACLKPQRLGYVTEGGFQKKKKKKKAFILSRTIEDCSNDLHRGWRAPHQPSDIIVASIVGVLVQKARDPNPSQRSVVASFAGGGGGHAGMGQGDHKMTTITAKHGWAPQGPLTLSMRWHCHLSKYYILFVVFN